MRKRLKPVQTSVAAMVFAAVLLGGAWAQPTEFKIEDPEQGYLTGEMGRSVAVDGDTIIAGAPYTDPNGPARGGVARVYRADGLGSWTLEAELIASDAAANDWFGHSVSVSGDTAVVGAIYDDDGGSASGSTYVFTRSDGVWTQQQKLTASDAAAGDHFGHSVSVSGDTAVVGAYGDNGDAGSAYVFIRSGGVWTQQQKLTASDAAADDYFGESVSVSGDTAVVGAVGDGDGGAGSGSAYVFTRSDGVWTQQQKLTASDAAADDHFGVSVSVSGNTAVVGAIYDDDGGSDSGSAYVFTRSGGVWSQQQKLTASDAAAYDCFGYSVSVSGDTVVVGAYGDNRFSGSATMFTRSGGVWTQQQKLTASDAAAGDTFGCSVSVSGDTAVVGALWDDGGDISGSAYIFTRSGGVWTQHQKISVSGAATDDNFGISVSVSGDTAVVGATGDDDMGDKSGSVYVFTRSGGVWTEQQKLTASDAAGHDLFGSSISVSGDTAVVGATGDDDGGSASGSAYVFTGSGGVWTQQQKLTASDAAVSDYFGGSVSISGDTAVVGASGDDDGGSASGSAYVFTRSGGVWTQQQKLTASDAAASDYFGVSASVSGDTAVIGAYQDDDGGSNSGSTYVFTRSGGVWTQQYKLTASDAAAGDLFGVRVSVSGDTAIVGARGDDDGGGESGSAYVFTRSGGVWTQQQKLTASDAAAGDHFGISVSVSGDTAVVGADRNDEGGSNSGSAYVFTHSGGVWTQQNKLIASDAAASDFFGYSVATDAGRVAVGAPLNDDPETDSGAAYIYTLRVPVTDVGWILF